MRLPVPPLNVEPQVSRERGVTGKPPWKAGLAEGGRGPGRKPVVSAAGADALWGDHRAGSRRGVQGAGRAQRGVLPSFGDLGVLAAHSQRGFWGGRAPWLGRAPLIFDFVCSPLKWVSGPWLWAPPQPVTGLPGLVSWPVSQRPLAPTPRVKPPAAAFPKCLTAHGPCWTRGSPETDPVGDRAGPTAQGGGGGAAGSSGG